MTSDELKEKVARAMWAKPLDEGCEPVPWEDATDEARNAYLMEASAAIDIVLEEAAKVCDQCPDSHWGPSMAAAIRAMKSAK